jgi:hypothetical protein
MNFTAKLLLNSLYGRFGMNIDFEETSIVNERGLKRLESNKNIIITNTKTLNNQFLVKHKNPSPDGSINQWKDFNINIAIACAVTAYGIIWMSKFKHPDFLKLHNLILYYTDTDSLYLNGPLPDSFVDPGRLGAMKLEGIYDKAVFLAPKVYALKNNQEEIIKIKGLSKASIKNSNINIELLSGLLFKDSNLTFKQEKWFRSLSKANIEIIDQIYTLKVTGNKRKLIYDNDKLINTLPLKLIDGNLFEE